MKYKDTRQNNLTPKEEEVMAILWQHGPLFVREILDFYQEPKPHFNTISTVVRTLEAKGWIIHEQIGNSHRYIPAIDVKEYRDKSVSGFINRFFGKSYISFVSALVKEEKISTDELRELLDIIESSPDKHS